MSDSNPDADLREQRLSSETVFNGKLLHVLRDTVRLPDQSQSTREYIVHPGAVMVVPLLPRPDGGWAVVLERQFRYPLGRVLLEFPAGKRDAGESAFACAARELREETGYTAGHWARAGVLHPVVAYSTECIEVWFARDLQPGPRQLDAGEFVETFEATPEQVLQWCQSGEITDAKTLIGALWLQNHLAGLWPLDWRSADSLQQTPP